MMSVVMSMLEIKRIGDSMCRVCLEQFIKTQHSLNIKPPAVTAASGSSFFDTQQSIPLVPLGCGFPKTSSR